MGISNKLSISLEVRELILTAFEFKYIDSLYEYLDYNYVETMRGVFSALYTLCKNYVQNKQSIDFLVEFIEDLKLNMNFEKFKEISFIIEEFRVKTKKLKLKQQRRISGLSIILDNILIYIYDRKYSQLEYLIFNAREIPIIKQYLFQSEDILMYRAEQGYDIFSLVLDKYINLSEFDNNNINYYYQILLLYYKRFGNEFVKNSIIYNKMINDSDLCNKPHIKEVINLFDPDFYITVSDVMSKYNIKKNFPSIIRLEDEKFILNHNGRVDFTYQECVTIDGENDLCIDDALYIEKNNNGTYTVYIHIVDIPSVIPYNSITREEALRRMENLYMSDDIISMYPDYLSHGICSLLPNENRNVVSYVFNLRSDYSLIENNFKIVKGVINVRHKLSYKVVDNILIKHILNDSISSKDKTLDLILFNLYHFSEQLRNRNLEKENYRNSENIINPEKHHESTRINYSPSSNIVHESMILANYATAKTFYEKDFPCIYRTGDFNRTVNINNVVKDLSKPTRNDELKKKSLTQLNECYVSGYFCSEPIFHKGLNLEVYSQATSPARRIGDSYIQYLMYELIFKKNVSYYDVKKWEYRIPELVRYLNETKKNNERFIREYECIAKRKVRKK